VTKTALITGVSGQDGAYLSKLLVDKGYRVIGTDRRSASGSLWRLQELGIADQVEVHSIELTEYANIERVVTEAAPDEVYNLAAQSFVAASFETPIYTSEVDALGVLRVLETLRRHHPSARFYQASTSEMFGKVIEVPQRESTPFHPRSPYGVAKVYGHFITVNYREAWGLFAVSGILFNHESPLRGEEFVTRKITKGVAALRQGGTKPLQLGNLGAERDWSFAGDCVEAMWLMLQQDTPRDFVVASGETHSVREFIVAAFAAAGMEVAWEGEDLRERGIEPASGRVLVEINPAFFRPAEVDRLIGDSSLARKELGWQPSMNFESLVEAMVHADMARLAKV
jgi:GDPmannose 4,6-dehydratase